MAKKNAAATDALIKAVLASKRPAVEAALAAGADPNALDDDWPVLHAALFRGKFDISELLVDHGANVDWADDRDLGTLLISLLDHEGEKLTKPDAKIALWLIEHGADCRYRRPDGSTPLMHAARRRNAHDVIDALVAHGAKPAADNNGDTPLHWAVQLEYGDPWVWERLLELGNKLEAKNHAGETPLSAAQLAWSRDAVAFLLGKGANRDVVVKGKTLLQRAIVKKQPKKMLDLLGR